VLQQTSIERDPPQNIELEQALLGALLLDNRAMTTISAAPADFADPLHAEIFSAIEADIAAGKVASPVSLKAAFADRAEVADGLTVPQYLGRLAANAATTINARSYAEGLRDLANRRALVSAAAELDSASRLTSVRVEQAANIAVQALDTVLSMARPGKRTRSDFNVAATNVNRSRGSRRQEYHRENRMPVVLRASRATVAGSSAIPSAMAHSTA
jgi:replicative DNA helicase